MFFQVFSLKVSITLTVEDCGKFSLPFRALGPWFLVSSGCSQPWRMSRGWVWPSVWGRSNHQERLCLLNSIIRTGGFSVCYKSFLVPYFSKHTVGKTNQVFRMPEVSNCPANPTWPLRAVLISHSLSEGPLWGPSHHQPMCKTGKTSTEENG